MTTTRRTFLQVLPAGVLGAAALPLPLACGAPPAGDVEVGTVDDFAVGDVKAIDGSSLIVGRDDGGIYAMTAICTHLGCDMVTNGSVAADQISCNCHGSAFDRDGAVVNGPAGAPLEHYLVTIDEAGTITVAVGSTVDADARAAVT